MSTTPSYHIRAPALTVTTGLTALLTVAGLLSLWVVPPPEADLRIRGTHPSPGVRVSA